MVYLCLAFSLGRGVGGGIPILESTQKWGNCMWGIPLPPLATAAS